MVLILEMQEYFNFMTQIRFKRIEYNLERTNENLSQAPENPVGVDGYNISFSQWRPIFTE